jgi:hypothetical protein
MLELPCKEFQGCKDKAGYGMVWSPELKRPVRAHRAEYELYHGVVLTRGELVCHRCDNPPCIEVTHLFVGSHAKNMEDRNTKGRQAKGADHGSATNSDANVALCRSLYTGKRGEKTDLAKRFGVSPKTIYNWLNGTNR